MEIMCIPISSDMRTWSSRRLSRFVPAGEVLFELDTVGREFFIILKGEVEIYICLPAQPTEEEKEAILNLPNDLESKKTKSKRYKSSFGLAKQSGLQLTTVLKKKDCTYLFHRTSLMTKINEIGEGKSFGEAALTSKKPCMRNATVYTKTDCYFAVLDKENFQRIINQHINLEVLSRITFVKPIEMFGVLPETALQTLVYSMQPARFVMRESIIKQGQPIDSVYIVIEGSVTLYRKVDTFDSIGKPMKADMRVV